MVRKLKSKTGGQGNILKQAQEMQARMIAVQEELKNKTVEASVGGGAVLVKVNGQKEVLSVNLSNDIVKEAQEDKEMLEDYLITVLNKAIQKATNVNEAEMAAVAQSGMPNIPGLDMLR